MNQVTRQRIRIIPLLLLSFILLAGLFYHTDCKAQHPIQLAAYVGFHTVDEGYDSYFGYRRDRRDYFWTEWRYIGRGCEKSCLINRWTGKVIRCERRCD